MESVFIGGSMASVVIEWAKAAIVVGLAFGLWSYVVCYVIDRLAEYVFE